MSSLENSHDSNLSQKKKIKIKSKSYCISKKINELYPSVNLKKDYLTYDFNIDEEYKKNIDIDISTHNIDRINSLPTLQIDIINNNCDDPELGDDYFREEEKTEVKESDIDIDSLEKETIGNKTYYFDYTKGIIYDLNQNIIGNIDELGEININ